MKTAFSYIAKHNADEIYSGIANGRELAHEFYTIEPVLKITCVKRPPFQTPQSMFHCSSPVLRDHLPQGTGLTTQ